MHKFILKKILILSLIFFNHLTFAQNITVVTENFPPYNYEEDGKIKGISTDVVRAVFKNLHIKFEPIIYPWARALAEAQEYENYLIYSIGRNAKREKLFK